MSALKVNKNFEVSVQELYNAWTNPGELKQWWKPMNKQLKTVENELKQGGAIRYEFEDGLVIKGNYDEVAENERLVYSWNWNFTESPVEETEFKLHVNFKHDGDGAAITIEQEGFEDDEHIKPHQKGWDEGLEQLHSYLGGGNSNAMPHQQDQTGKPPISGYNETPEQVKVAGG